MAYSRVLMPRNLALISFISLGGGYLMFKPRRTLTQRPAGNPAGDYSVSVDRSGGGI